MSGGVLGGHRGVLGSCGAILDDFFGNIGAKMGATWAKLEPSWQQVGPKMGHVRWPCWPHFGRLKLNLGSIFGAFWQMRWISKNIEKP